MLTSKDILESTGISRATLNNYIAAGLIARPEVLPPAPDDGAAPRIGYFPDDTLERIRTIQRLKREGWPMARIAAHLAGGATAAQAPAPALQAAPVATPAPEALPRLRLVDAGTPAYLVDERFHLVWHNPACAASPLSPIAGLRVGDSVLAHLAASGAPGGEAVLRFHLGAAKDRGFAPEPGAPLERLYEEVQGFGAMPVARANLAAAAPVPSRQGFAVHFREHVLFAFAPAAAAQPAAAPARAPARAPTLGSVAVLVATLHDAPGLWARLSPHEYFELANEVWGALETVFRKHSGVLGRHPGEGVVCYFLREGDDTHLANALAAARAARAAMHAISRRWQERKRWELELAMDIGLDEGQEWMGAVGADPLRVMGEAADRAEQLSRCGRGGPILVTRGFIGKLPAADRERLEFAAPADASGRRGARHTFAPLGAVCPAVPPRLADVAVAEILEVPPAAA